VSVPGPEGSPIEALRRDASPPPADDLESLSRSLRVAQQVVTSDRVGDEFGRSAIAEIGAVGLVTEAIVAQADEQLDAVDGVGPRGEIQARGPAGSGDRARGSLRRSPGIERDPRDPRAGLPLGGGHPLAREPEHRLQDREEGDARPVAVVTHHLAVVDISRDGREGGTSAIGAVRASRISAAAWNSTQAPAKCRWHVRAKSRSRGPWRPT